MLLSRAVYDVIMINIEHTLTQKFPALATQPPAIRKPTISLLRKLTFERVINNFLEKHADLEGFDFIDQVFEHFNFSYQASARSRANIPAEGRVVIIANHPIGSLDGLALLRLVSEVRKDVKIVANDILGRVDAIKPLLISLDNMGGAAYRQSYKQTLEALNNEEAIIIFPAGEVSRARPTGVRDTQWHSGFLHFARKAKAPILPIYVKAKNSLLFYSASALFKPFGTLLLIREMFNKESAMIDFRVGETIPAHALKTDKLNDKALIKRLKKHLYKLSKKKPRTTFVTEKTIAHPEDRQALKHELSAATLLGNTRDNNQIYVFDYHKDSAVIREIGRLREVTFRKVGEGTGAARDLDQYDKYYRHLILWDDSHLEIAGAYRIAPGPQTIAKKGMDGFYTSELFDFTPAIRPLLEEGMELGRSFVNPNYWGKASLDYLWQGIGAYIKHNPNMRYLIGPISMSADYPIELREALVYYYRRFAPCNTNLASAMRPFTIPKARINELTEYFGDCDKDSGFKLLQALFKQHDCKIPTLFKQYAALFDEGGFQLMDFSVDPDFGYCIDGLLITDVSRLKANKRKRYIGEEN